MKISEMAKEKFENNKYVKFQKRINKIKKMKKVKVEDVSESIKNMSAIDVAVLLVVGYLIGKHHS